MVKTNRATRCEIAEEGLNTETPIRIRRRRNLLLGLWAAAELGVTGADAVHYAEMFVAIGDESPDDALVRRIVEDTRASGTTISDAAVRTEMERLSRIAELEYAAGEPFSDPRAA